MVLAVTSSRFLRLLSISLSSCPFHEKALILLNHPVGNPGVVTSISLVHVTLVPLPVFSVRKVLEDAPNLSYLTRAFTCVTGTDVCSNTLPVRRSGIRLLQLSEAPAPSV